MSKIRNAYAGVPWLKRQWPWWVAGLLTALAEIINFLFLPLGNPKHKFIGVTSGMARMLAGVESTLFGGSLIATKPDYQPAIQWVIIGAMIAALALAWLEGETRSWARYPKKTLVFVALGAFLFAWGTRVAGGCTLHHLLGGFPAMNLKSWVVMLSATVGALIGFVILRNLNLTQFFKSQETRWYVVETKHLRFADGLTASEEVQESKILRYVIYAILILIMVLIAYNAIAGNDYAVRVFGVPYEKTKIYKSMLSAQNLPNIIMLLIVGALLGISVAKTGFGTECALINPEMGREVEQGDAQAARRWRIPYSLRTVFLSYQPFAALSLHIFLTGLVMFIAFAFFGIMEGHHWATEAFAAGYVGPKGAEFHKVGTAIRENTTLSMDIFGGLLLGLGTIFMIGCEFRNYGRAGLLYITGLLIWPFFYLGYLPYTLARDFWDGLMASGHYAPTTFVPALIAPKSPAVQMLIYALYLALWLYFFVWAVKRGARNLGVEPAQILKMSSEDMYLARMEKLQAEGRWEEVEALEKELYAMAQK